MLQTLYYQHPAFLYLFLGLCALSVGSFLNVLIYRLPIMIQSEFKQQCYEALAIDKKEKPINLFLPRSFCTHCHAKLPFWQNIPLLSYLFLRGRCYQCKTPISLRYPFTELLTGILSLAAAWHFGFTVHLIFALSAIGFLIPMALIDLEQQMLPDCLSLSFLWLGLMANTQSLFVPLPNAVFSAVGAYLSLWSFVHLYYLITGKMGMGRGDFKLFAALGAWFGWTYLPIILLSASIMGLCFGALYLYLSQQSKETPIPFGPFLCLAGLGVLFYIKFPN